MWGLVPNMWGLVPHIWYCLMCVVRLCSTFKNIAHIWFSHVPTVMVQSCPTFLTMSNVTLIFIKMNWIEIKNITVRLIAQFNNVKTHCLHFNYYLCRAKFHSWIFYKYGRCYYDIKCVINVSLFYWTNITKESVKSWVWIYIYNPSINRIN